MADDRSTEQQLQDAQEKRDADAARKIRLVRAIGEQARRPGAKAIFLKHICSVALKRAKTHNGGKGESPEDLLAPESELTLEKKYYLLAAFYDALSEANPGWDGARVITASEWPGADEFFSVAGFKACWEYWYSTQGACAAPNDAPQPTESHCSDEDMAKAQDYVLTMQHYNDGCELGKIPDDHIAMDDGADPGVLWQYLEDVTADLLPKLEEATISANQPQVAAPAAASAPIEKPKPDYLPRAISIAHGQYQHAEEELLERSKHPPTDKECYEYVREHQEVGEHLSKFPTWQRQVSRARKLRGESKNTTRRGRAHGGSVVWEDET